MSAKRRPGAGGGAPVKKSRGAGRGQLNAELDDAAARSALRDAWRSRGSCSHGTLEADSSPFPHCVIRNFLRDEEFASRLQGALLRQPFHSKNTDLYNFTQSDDLKSSKDPCITELRSVLFGWFRLWLSDLLDLELEPTVDVSCAKYQHTDVLLCHDDELEGRRVAFILYLVPPWQPSDGGALDLYSTDEHGQPACVVKSLIPCWNSLVFFEVSPVSFHQVSEVVAEDKCRLSLSGWFHGPSLPRPPRYIEPVLPRQKHLPRDESVLYEWVSDVYMNLEQQVRVQQEFEDSSEIRLPNFLKEEKLKEVISALQLAEIHWDRSGPPNKRCYEAADLRSVPDSVRSCWELFCSEAFFLLLSNLTGLKLHTLANDPDSEDDEEDEEQATSSAAIKKDGSTAVCVGEIRRWTRGCYTLLHDSDNREFALDLLLTLGCSGWQQDFGGFTSYVAHGEDEELLTVLPEENSLALVYRDTDTLKFVKHVNQRSSTHWQQPPRSFYDFSITYYE
ncbi:prolyl 3-hydroxylase OGFOD1 [Denticeps clupeoides]|nr:prolyl 3-hydroxylase OGFOD1 [Denticeps clupeoides]